MKENQRTVMSGVPKWTDMTRRNTVRKRPETRNLKEERRDGGGFGEGTGGDGFKVGRNLKGRFIIRTLGKDGPVFTRTRELRGRREDPRMTERGPTGGGSTLEGLPSS